MINILKRLKEPLIKKYEQFNFYQKWEIRNFKSGFPLVKGAENLLQGKASQPYRNIRTFPKESNQKSMILLTKTRKIRKVQKSPQKASRSLWSRDMSNLNFSQNSQKIANLGAISPREKCSVIF